MWRTRGGGTFLAESTPYIHFNVRHDPRSNRKRIALRESGWNVVLTLWRRPRSLSRFNRRAGYLHWWPFNGPPSRLLFAPFFFLFTFFLSSSSSYSSFFFTFLFLYHDNIKNHHRYTVKICVGKARWSNCITKLIKRGKDLPLSLSIKCYAIKRKQLNLILIEKELNKIRNRLIRVCMVIKRGKCFFFFGQQQQRPREYYRKER